MNRILCPTDFSDTAENAINYAARLAKIMDAELTLLNVQSLFDLSSAEMMEGKQETVRAASMQLEAEALEISREFKIPCGSVVDPTFHKLSTVIEHESGSYDLVVMGSNGAGDLYKFFNGSNTYNTIVKTNTPVLLIPGGYAYSEIKSIVFAYDYFHHHMLPIDPLVNLVHALQAKVMVLQVVDQSLTKAEEENLAALQNSMRDLFADDIELSFRTIRAEDPAHGIHEYFIRSGADVLALCTKHRNIVQRFFHKSVVKHITSISDYPVFVFH